MAAHDVAVEQGDAAAAHFHQARGQRARQGGLARAGQAGKKHGEALALARRILPVQFGEHFGKAVPVGNFQPGLHAALEFLAAQGQQARPRGRLGFGQIFGAIFHIHHAGIGDEPHADLVGEFAHWQVGMRLAEVFAAAAVAVGQMLAARNQQATAMVARDDGAQQQGAGAGFARRRRQERQLGGGGGEAFANGEKAAHQTKISRRIGDIAPHLRVQQQVGFVLDRAFQTELELRAVHRLTCLPGDDTPPAARANNARNSAGVARKLVKSGAAAVPRPQPRRPMPGFVVLPDVADSQHGQHEAFAIAQGDAISGFQLARSFLAAAERDRQGPECAVIELHPGFDLRALRARHVTGERRIGAGHQHFELALLPPVEVERGQAQGLLLQCLALCRVDEIDEGVAIGRDQLIHVSSG